MSFTENWDEFTSAPPQGNDSIKAPPNIPVLKIKQTTQTRTQGIQRFDGKRPESMQKTIETPIKSETNKNKMDEPFSSPTVKGHKKQEQNEKILVDHRRKDGNHLREFNLNNSETGHGNLSANILTHKSRNFTTVLSRSLFTSDRDSVELFSYWHEEGEVMCESGSRFEYFPSHVRICNILLDRHHARAPLGGENVTEVLNQTEANEFLKLTPGFFQVSQG